MYVAECIDMLMFSPCVNAEPEFDPSLPPFPSPPLPLTYSVECLVSGLAAIVKCIAAARSDHVWATPVCLSAAGSE